MNPVRKELEFAVKAVLSELGVKAQKAKAPKSQPQKSQPQKKN